MGYASIIDVDLILANALTSSRPDATDNKKNFLNLPGGTGDDGTTGNLIPNSVVNYYIRLADSIIDGTLSQMYKTPLRKCQRGQWLLDATIDEYNQNVELDENHSLVPGDEVVIRNDDTGDEEVHVINALVDQNSFITLEPITTTFSVSNEVRVFRIGYPPLVNQISARYAASFIYDKYFAAQAAPNVSDYGNTMRFEAMGRLNDILNGKAILECQLRVGDLFGNPWLDSSYSVRELPQDFNTSERNMSSQK